ncbi:DUF3667 domain-containing protein [Polaribacter sp.]|uniref:DUF3667 domain-containing protein n=1 Tax=Polaribacter sp. TaxID=1920175 RepID=UPI003F6BC74D
MFNFEAKFWTTIIPLLINPGKVSRDYIDGKRQRYSNPFRFYLTVSIIFFLIVGLTKTIEKYEALTHDSYAETEAVEEQKDSVIEEKKIPTVQELDSIKNELDKDLKKSFIPESARKKILEEVEKNAKDTTKTKNNGVNFNFGDTDLDRLSSFVKKYPSSKADVALDSLGLTKNFTNRFLFTRAKTLYAITKDDDSKEQFLSQALSYGSIALFILLPFFTLFLRFYYIRRKFTYIDHLIFVFHIQTVFFMLFSIFFILRLCTLRPEIWIFILLFLLYLFIAMKKFYQQGYIKTFLKFILLNLSYLLVASVGFILVFLVSFALF